MLKETITYKDFNDNTQVEDLYFNLSKTELLNYLHLSDDLEKLQKKFSGPERDLEPKEIQEILDLVKLFAKISYGVKSEDGKRFIKGDQVWLEFTETAAYDAFLFSLFEDPEKAIGFLLNVMPQDLREEAESMIPEGVRQPTDRQQKQERPVRVVELPDVVETMPDEQAVEKKEPTTKEIAEMSTEEFLAWKAAHRGE